MPSAVLVLLSPWWSPYSVVPVMVVAWVLPGAAATWMVRLRRRRQRRLVPVARRGADGLPPGGVGGMGQEVRVILDTLGACQAALRPVRDALPDPDAEVPPFRRSRCHRAAAVRLRDADALLAVAAASLDGHLRRLNTVPAFPATDGDQS